MISNAFPCLNTTIAYYDQATFFIHLNTISQQDLTRMKSNVFAPENIGKWKTLFHEKRHNIDHFSTLWGQKNLLKYSKALNARLKNDPNMFDAVIEYKKQDNQLFYAKYYSEEFNKVPVRDMDKRWKWQPTTGLRFKSNGLPDKDRPIPMVRFSTWDNIPLIRVPISIATLLETNAVSEETKLDIAYFSTLSDADKLKQGKNHKQKELLNFIYNQDLAVYNVAVHICANLLGLTDTIPGFIISSTIATLALNLPPSLVSKLPVDEEQISKWGDRTKFMLQNNEYGYIYFVLLTNYARIFREKNKFDINDVLAGSNLPKYDEILSIVDTEMVSIEKELSKYENFAEIFLSHIATGRKMFKELGLGFEKKSLYETSFQSTIIANDTKIDVKEMSASEVYNMQPINGLNISSWYNISSILNQKLTELFEVRGI